MGADNVNNGFLFNEFLVSMFDAKNKDALFFGA